MSSTVDRRRFLGLTGLGAASLVLGPSRTPASVKDRYAKLDSDEYLGPAEVLATIEDDEVFTEGPAFGHGALYFTNVPMSKILKWDPATSKLSTKHGNTGKTNGLYFEPNGSLLACEGGNGMVVRHNGLFGRRQPLAKEFNGFPLAPPNDVCRDANGRIYFTSRPSPSGNDPRTGNVNAVYRIDPDGTLTQLLGWPDVHMPNGIVTSPDEKTLYLIEAHPDADHNRNILAFDLDGEGNLSNRRTLIDFYPGRSGDGMCNDAKGNLYVAAGLHATRKSSETLDTKPGIHVISPKGRLLAYRETPVDTVTNCTFGDADLKTLYVTCGPKLVSMRTTIPGKPTYRVKG